MDSLETGVRKTDIKLSAFVVEHNIPFRVADHFAELMRSCFPDSKIAGKLRLKRTKCTVIVKHIIAKEEK